MDGDQDFEPRFRMKFAVELASAIERGIERLSDDECHRHLEGNWQLQEKVLALRYKQRRSAWTHLITSVLYVLTFVGYATHSLYWAQHDRWLVDWLYIGHDLIVSIAFLITLVDMVTLPLAQCSSGSSIYNIINIDRVMSNEVENSHNHAGAPVVVWLGRLTHHPISLPTIRAFLTLPERRRGMTAYYNEQQKQLAKLYKYNRLKRVLKLFMLNFTAVVMYQFSCTNMWGAFHQAFISSAYIPHYINLIDALNVWKIHRMLNIDHIEQKNITYLHQSDGIPYMVYMIRQHQQYH